MANSLVPEDVMQLFARSFAAGSQAIGEGERIGLAALAQKQDYNLGTQKLALGAQELAQQGQDNAAKIALQRESLQSDAALKRLQIEQHQQEAAKNFILEQQKMDQDRASFAEAIRARRAMEENQRLTLGMHVTELEKENKLKEAELSLKRDALNKKTDWQQMVEERRQQQADEAMGNKKLQLLASQFNAVKKEAIDPLTGVPKAGFITSDGALDEDKIYELAKARTSRLIDSGGWAKQEFPAKSELDQKPAENKFEEGQVYTDAKGKKAKYQGGKFVPL